MDFLEEEKGGNKKRKRKKNKLSKVNVRIHMSSSQSIDVPS
jgi:hypothetical protein